MPELELDPRDTIDRTVEQELFANLVSFETAARMLVISDRRGRGKSTLLRRLVYNCKREIKPAVPACLIDLADLSDSPDTTEFAFIAKVVSGLKIDQLFPKFIALNRARGERNYGPFETDSASMYGQVTAKGEVRGDVTGLKIIQPAVVQLAAGEFTPAQEQYARQKCIEAFFEDLRVVCAARPIVILLDHWEGCNHDLREWITDAFLQQHCFHATKAQRPAKLAVVVAGNSYDGADERFGIRDQEFVDLFKDEPEYNETVLSKASLSDWEADHVREFLKLHRYTNVTDEDIDYLRHKLKKGLTLQQILGAAERLEL